MNRDLPTGTGVAQMARSTGLHQPQVSNWKSGKHVSERVDRIIRAEIESIKAQQKLEQAALVIGWRKLAHATEYETARAELGLDATDGGTK